jgi:hypothetical protein
MTNQWEGRGPTRMSENPEAAFIAKITANTTHELRNVLSIVKESAGLMEDLLQAEEHGATPRPERLLELAGLIEAQVERGAGLITDLHRLAHSLDPATAGVDLIPELERTASFCERFARERRQTVTVRSTAPDVTVAMHALPLQMTLFAAAEYCMGQMPDGSTVTMSPHVRGGQPVVEFVGDGRGESSSPTAGGTSEWSELVAFLAAYGATAEAVEGAFRIRVDLPGLVPSESGQRAR